MFAFGLTGKFILLSSVFIVAACGLVYQLIAGAVSSYLLGDAVTRFSLVIGVFLCAMGVGSYISKLFQNNLLKSFVEIEIWIGVIGGLASIIMFSVNALAQPYFPVVFYSLCIVIGALVGIEVPLIVRIINEDSEISQALSHVLTLDYIGALAGSLLFPFLIMPFVGLSRASAVFGILNLAVAAIGLKIVPNPGKWIAVRLIIASLLLVSALIYSKRLIGYFEDIVYQDNIIYAHTSPYQRIILTRWRDDLRLYLNGHLQFCSIDEARYHESLVIPAMEAARSPETVLILGGGDGLAAREVLKYHSVKQIVLIDIDSDMTRLGQTRAELIALNRNSLNSPLVNIINQDAMKYLEESQEFFDVILIDLPDPNSDTLAKLYSTAFYTLCQRRMKPRSVLATQAVSPFYAPKAFISIIRTIEAAGSEEHRRLKVMPYHVNIPSFGEWGFIIAAGFNIPLAELAPSVPTRFLTPERTAAMFQFGKDIDLNADVSINRLDDPRLFQYYREGWRRFNH